VRSVRLALSGLSVPTAVGILNALDAVLVPGAAHVCPDLEKNKVFSFFLYKLGKMFVTSVNWINVLKSFFGFI